MSAEEVFKKYHDKLCKILPMENPSFLRALEKYDILTKDARCGIQEKKTKADKADHYIQYVIKTSNLPKLLAVMEQYCNDYTNHDVDLQKLFVHMIAEMSGKFGSYGLIICQLCNYVLTLFLHMYKL